MLVRELMTKPAVCCTPRDTAQVAASLMRKHDIGAIPVVSELSDPLLEGIVTDRDLCCGVVADAKNANAVQISEVMTRVPVTCEPEYTREDCVELMRENQVRRIPIVDKRGRCIGIVAQADVARCAQGAQVAGMLKEISEPPKGTENLRFEKGYFYCGTLHEEEQILLLNRRRELRKKVEAVL